MSNIILGNKWRLFLFLSFSSSYFLFSQKPVKIVSQQISECINNCVREERVLVNNFKNGILYLNFKVSRCCSKIDSVLLVGLFGDTLKFSYKKRPGKAATCICYVEYDLKVSGLQKKPSVIMVDRAISTPENKIEFYDYYIRIKDKIWTNKSAELNVKWDSILYLRNPIAYIYDLCNKLGNDSFNNIEDEYERRIEFPNDGIEFRINKLNQLKGIILNLDSFKGKLPQSLNTDMTEDDIIKRFGTPDFIINHFEEDSLGNIDRKKVRWRVLGYSDYHLKIEIWKNKLSGEMIFGPMSRSLY